MANDRTSDNPILFLGISPAYLSAFEVIWENEFERRHRALWRLDLLFHPVSHLLGVSLETAMKGLLACRGSDVPRKHDLKTLWAMVADADLAANIASSLTGLPVPEEIIELNPEFPREEIEGFYRQHYFHFDMINSIYDRPFATRYPVLGGHSLPDAIALRRMAGVLQERLSGEVRAWQPKRKGA